MHWRDHANRPEPIAPAREPRRPRDLDTSCDGNMAECGYERIARRPRMRDMEIMPETRADRIEEIFSFPPLPDMDAY